MTQYHDNEYLALVRDVLENGTVKTDRTGTGTISVMSRQMRFDLSDGSIPLLTTKKMFTRGIIKEIEWYFKGLTNIKFLLDSNVHIWDEWVPFIEYNPPHNFDADILELKKREYLYEGNIKARTGDESRYTPTTCGIGFLGQYPYDWVEQKQRTRLHNIWSKIMERCYNKDHDKFAFYGGAGVTVCERWHDFSAFAIDVQKLPNYWLWNVEGSDYQLDKDFFGGNQYSPEHCVFLPQRDNKALAQASGLKYKAEHEDGTICEFVNITKWCEHHNLSVSSVHYAINDSISHSHKGWTFSSTEPQVGHVFRENIFRDDLSLLDLGPVYGAMWRKWPDTQIVPFIQSQEYIDRGYTVIGRTHPDHCDSSVIVHKKIDQLADAIELLKTSPDSRRMIVNSWHPALLPTDLKTPKNNPRKGLQALPPCHCQFQFYVADGKLSCDLRQRSCDVGLGVPFNIVQYSIITHILAKMVGLQPGEFVWNGVDVHIYSNHVEKLREQLNREPYPSPYINLADSILGKNPEDVTSEEIEVVGYTQFHPRIELDVAT